MTRIILHSAVALLAMAGLSPAMGQMAPNGINTSTAPNPPNSSTQPPQTNSSMAPSAVLGMPGSQTPTMTVINNTLPPPPASAMNKTYPACTSQAQDNCTNPNQMSSNSGH